jgi:hypothetical protein
VSLSGPGVVSAIGAMSHHAIHLFPAALCDPEIRVSIGRNVRWLVPGAAEPRGVGISQTDGRTEVGLSGTQPKERNGMER